MKILVLTPRPLWPVHDGGTVATVRCASGLAAAGARVTVLAMITGKHRSHGMPSPGWKPEYVTDYITVPVDTRIRPLPMLLNLFFSREPYDLSRFRSREYSETLRAVLDGNQFDLVQCEGPSFALYLGQIKKQTSVPVVLRAHNLEHMIREQLAANALNPVRKSYLANLARRLMALEMKAARQFDAVVPISEQDALWFRSVTDERPVFLSETGAEEASFLKEPPAEHPRVGFIGAMNWQPNAEGLKWFITQVWPLVTEKIPASTLCVAGRGLYPGTLLPGGHNIINAGEPDNARAFIASNHVMIAPLFTGSGLRIKIIDALSAGRPVVATPLAAQGIDASEGMAITVAEDAGSFSSALIRYLDNQSFRSSAGMEAVRLAKQRYDNSTLTASLLRFYTELAHGS